MNRQSDRVSLPIFSTGDLQSCSEGKCSGCGVCCDVFDVGTVPDPAAPHDITRFVRKQAGERCPHLFDDFTSGRKKCAVHELKKTHPHLKVCDGYDGTDREGGYAFLREKKREFVFGPQTADQATIALEWLRDGILQDIDLKIQNTADLFCALNYLHMTSRIPHELYALMRMRDTLTDWQKNNPGQMDELMKQLGIHPSAEGLRGEFYREYVMTEIIEKTA